MHCPNCGSTETRVKDSRYEDDKKKKRRRRRCKGCDATFVTVEQIVSDGPTHVIKSGEKREREPFDSDKIRKGVLQAISKRPVTVDDVDRLMNTINARLADINQREIETQEIGAIVMQELLPLDRVAYIRFASIYRNFKDVGAFTDEIEGLPKPKRSKVPDKNQDEFPFDEGDDSGRDNGK